ncbi:YcxB family protein [Hirschia baltica]|uniref:YcxB-like C-terminal domain-containing protein n=1 Tax=Hirschia baltica (strain ATCC 49814 / DSM 5838 / IFAM 1418) TaxID=582402 RepID=C6XRX2_HIRBI|nr:YcxB family protein [Hirschia baltica]ACT60732.1 hypothetical protein Hbal_3064 [Hirschia baltica ATCC 49814]
MPETEVPLRPDHSTGIELSYRDHISASGYISPQQLKKFIKTRRSNGLGPTTIYYAGVAAPVISASTLNLFETFFSQYNISDYTVMMLSMFFSASAGLSWFLIFNRLAERQKSARDNEITQAQSFKIDASGILLNRKNIESKIEWPAIVDIRTTKHYIAFIVEGANDFFIPVDWFKDRDQMKEATNKIAALRPPPFNT